MTRRKQFLAEVLVPWRRLLVVIAPRYERLRQRQNALWSGWRKWCKDCGRKVELMDRIGQRDVEDGAHPAQE